MEVLTVFQCLERVNASLKLDRWNVKLVTKLQNVHVRRVHDCILEGLADSKRRAEAGNTPRCFWEEDQPPGVM